MIELIKLTKKTLFVNFFLRKYQKKRFLYFSLKKKGTLLIIKCIIMRLIRLSGFVVALAIYGGMR